MGGTLTIETTSRTSTRPHSLRPKHQRPIYLDHHATTPVDQRVADLMYEVMTGRFGNPNSAEHPFGEDAVKLLDQAAMEVGKLVGAPAESVRFTTGSSEGIHFALNHAIDCAHRRPARIAVGRIEHRALLACVEDAESSGRAEVTWIPADEFGTISVASLGQALRRGVDLVCLMAANNEVGTIQPVAEAAQMTRSGGALLLVDATQAVGRIAIDMQDVEIDYLVVSGHKIYGPKGVGALVAPGMPNSSPTLFTGPHPPTPNVPGIVGLGEACRLRRNEMAADEPRIAALRDRLEAQLLARVPEISVNGNTTARLAGNLHFSAKNAPNDLVLSRLRETVAISSGAACSNGVDAPSHVLVAMGLAEWRQQGALRVGIGRANTEPEIDFAAEAIAAAIQNVRAL